MTDMLLSILQSTDTITSQFIFNGYAALVSAYKPAILALAALSITTLGYAVTNGWVKLSESEIVKRVLIMAFALAFALHWDFFSKYVYDFFTNAPNDIATHIVQSVPGSTFSDQTSVYTSLQQAFYSGIGIGQAVWERGGVGDPLAYLYAVGIWTLTLAFSGLALIEMVAAKFGLAIYLVLAPIIIPLFIFPATKSAVFDGWLRHIVTFSFIPIFVMSAVTLGLMLMQSTLGNLQTSIQQDNMTITNIVPYFLYALVNIGLLIKASMMAASTAGGIATSMASGLTGVASSARRKFMPLGSEVKKPDNTNINISGDGNTVHHNSGQETPTPNVDKSFQSAGEAIRNDMSIDKQYFELAKDWQYDRVEAAKLNANRWFVAFIGASIIIVLMTIAIIVTLPLKTLVPVVIHQNTKTGEVWVDRPSTNYVPETQAETEADIVRYITSRESYTADDINERFHLIMLLSAKDIALNYAQDQANSNKTSPINVLGATGTRTVQIEDIVFIDKENIQEVRHFRQPSSNLAKVDFTTTTIDSSGTPKTEYWVATIGWNYQGLPQSEAVAWDNWNGFTVTTYRVDQRNLST